MICFIAFFLDKKLTRKDFYANIGSILKTIMREKYIVRYNVFSLELFMQGTADYV